MEREDLGALFGRITRRLMTAERPILDAHGLSMWGYAVLSRLAEEPATTQLALAGSIGYDKSRLVALLDELARAGLIVREADPSDRRAHIVRLTRSGRTRHAAAVQDVRAMESALLGELTAEQVDLLLGVLVRLADGR